MIYTLRAVRINLVLIRMWGLKCWSNYYIRWLLHMISGHGWSKYTFKYIMKYPNSIFAWFQCPVQWLTILNFYLLLENIMDKDVCMYSGYKILKHQSREVHVYSWIPGSLRQALWLNNVTCKFCDGSLGWHVEW